MNHSTIRLRDIAHTRSGDKGNHANLGVLAYTSEGYQYLKDRLSEELVAAYFASLGCTEVERFELPRIDGLNFVLYNVLGGGASQSLRIDTQGKLLGTAALEIELPRPKNFDAMQRQAR